MEQTTQDSKLLNKYPDIITPVYETKRRRIRNFPQHKNRASECGHPCERYLVYCRTHWEDRLLHGPELEFIFEGGRLIEDMALRELQEAGKDFGFEIYEQQRAFTIKEIDLTGHIDAKIRINEVSYPLEIKGINHYDFVNLNTIEDFHNSNKVWIRKYPAQLMMYLMGAELECGVFYIKDKLNFQPKTIWVDLDYDYAEQIYQKMERVNDHVKNGTLPEQCGDYSVCERCAFIHLCLPEIKRKAIDFADDPEFEDKLARREELKPYKSEYDALDREVKKMLDGKENVIIGDFMIHGKWVERKAFTVAASKYWKPNITRLSPQEAVEPGQDF